jgi:hypothetical protein
MKSIKKLLRTSTRLESSMESEITSEERTRWNSWVSRMANLIISRGHAQKQVLTSAAKR